MRIAFASFQLFLFDQTDSNGEAAVIHSSAEWIRAQIDT